MAAASMKKFCMEIDGHPLLAWRRRFEKASVHYGRFPDKASLKVSLKEFTAAANAMGFKGDAKSAFQELDHEKTGYLALIDFDSASEDLWVSFRRWCGRAFTSTSDMCFKLCSEMGVTDMDPKHCTRQKSNSYNGQNALGIEIKNEPIFFSKRRVSRDVGTLSGFDKAHFVANAARLGWYAGNEEMLFDALDVEGTGNVAPELLQWLDSERRRELKRNASKKRTGKRGSMGIRLRVQAMQSLQSFIVFLRLRYGCLFRAWRDILDREGIMHIGRAEVLQACRALNWSGDVNLLWKGMDPDEIGKTSIGMLDPEVARALALFKHWSDQRFGNARNLMKALNAVDEDKARANVLTLEEWEAACEELNCPCDATRVFEILDWDNRTHLMYSDLKCFDRWTPLPYLLAEPDPEAAAELKKKLLLEHKHALPAWRNGMDRDGCGRVYWSDFKSAVEGVGFEGNIEGAWLAMDADSSGYITLYELDKEAADTLVSFRRWSNQKYGGVKAAFNTMTNSQDSVTIREFKRLLKQSGYRGDSDLLLKSLDCDGGGDLAFEEVAFLDEWALADMEENNDIATEKDSKGRFTRRRSSIEIKKPMASPKDAPYCSGVSGFRLLQFIGWSSDRRETSEFHSISPAFRSPTTQCSRRRHPSKVSQDKPVPAEVHTRPVLPRRWGKVPPCIGGRPYFVGLRPAIR